MGSFDKHKHHRRSIRLKSYDYRQSGAYFVTICVQNHIYLFGTEKELNDAGQMVKLCWLALPQRFPTIALDEYVIMPNHFHAIIHITDNHHVGAVPCACPGACACPNSDDAERGNHKGLPLQNDDTTTVPCANPESRGNHKGLPLQNDDTTTVPCANPESRQPQEGQPQGIAPTDRPRLGDIIGAFKSITTNHYIDGVRNLGWPAFDKRVWQRNYYEHIIRHNRALNAIREYIRQNPLRWQLDRYNPDAIGRDPKARQLWELMHTP